MNQFDGTKGRRLGSSSLEGVEPQRFTGSGPCPLLVLLEHADGLPGIKAKLVLEDPRCSFPGSVLMPGNKKRASDMLDVLIRLFHLRPRSEALRPCPSDRKPFQSNVEQGV